MNFKTWLPLGGPSWYQEKSWDQALGNLYSRGLALQGTKDILRERTQFFFLADHTRVNDFTC